MGPSLSGQMVSSQASSVDLGAFPLSSTRVSLRTSQLGKETYLVFPVGNEQGVGSLSRRHPRIAKCRPPVIVLGMSFMSYHISLG